MPSPPPRPLMPRMMVMLVTLLAAPACAPRPTLMPTPGAVFLTGAGDIADCGTRGADSTAALLDRIPGLIFTTGDNAYPSGSESDFEHCFDPTWGRHLERIRPTPGNHEYWTPGARHYFSYFGGAAGDPWEGWYAYDYGGWRVIALNSNLQTEPDSEQLQWLRKVLAEDPRRCTVAYFHHPLVSSGAHGDNTDAIDQADVRPFWAALYGAGAEIVLVGHDHHYERFAPITPMGAIDRDRGIRQFVVGTGGGRLRGRGVAMHPASEVFMNRRHGLLKLELREGGYGWEFVSVKGRVVDSGEGVCH